MTQQILLTISTILPHYFLFKFVLTTMLGYRFLNKGEESPDSKEQRTT